MPELAPYVEDQQSWAARRAFYEELLAALVGELEADGGQDWIVGALPGNTAAIRLYQRFGFRPTWTYLSRFAGRP